MTPPYPAEIRAKGWRFDLDYEQIEQSDTWDLAGPDGRPWLLMLWFTAWRQAPCGSLPADEAVIAAKIGMPPKMWQKHRSVLLRGWSEATDGRMYHATLTAKVIEMVEKRRKETDRKAMHRHGTPAPSQGNPEESHGSDAGVPLLSRGTDAGFHPEGDTDTDRLQEESKATPPTPRKRGEVDGFDPLSIALPGWLPSELWGEWVQSRRETRHPLKSLACKLQIEALEKWRSEGHDALEILRVSIRNGYQGLVAPKGRPNGAPKADDWMNDILARSATQ